MEKAQDQKLLLEDESYYKGEKKLEDKVAYEKEQVEVVGRPQAGAADDISTLDSRLPWTSSIFACFGSNDAFCSSDFEVCMLGTVAPCVLYGSNAERLDPLPGTFCNHCLRYSSLLFLGNFLFNSNCLAPCSSFPVRTAIRRKFNLQGTGEMFVRSLGCYTGMLESDVDRERCDQACDFATHFFCHPCALCQEGREIRRRLPHPGFNSGPYAMLPPGEQAMLP